MKIKPKYSLQRTMIIYFLLVGFASLLVGVEFVAETHGRNLRGYWLAQIEAQTDEGLDRMAVFKPLDHLRNTCTSGGEAVTRAKALLERDALAPADIADVRTQLGHLEDELTALNDLVGCFKFYAIERTVSHG